MLGESIFNKGGFNMNLTLFIRSGRKRIFLTALVFCLCFGFYTQVCPRQVSAAIQTVSGGAFEKSGNNWVYRKADRSLLKNGVYKINNLYYYFDANGYRKSGWQKIGSTYYYFGKSNEGYMYRSRWLTYGNSIYYLKSNGKRATGWMTINKKTYYFNTKGQRLHGWQKIDGKLYYLGTAEQGYRFSQTYVSYKGNIYYLQDTGAAATGWVYINKELHYFSSGGAAASGKKTIGKNVYYFDSKGTLLYMGADLKVSCNCALLIEYSSGKVIYAKHANTKVSSAPVAKIMTAALALEKKSVSTAITASQNAVSQEPTKLGMKKGERFTLKNLLYSILVTSHNDAAMAIAEGIGGSSAKYVSLMNRKAKSLNCTATKFTSPVGLNHDGKDYTTANDIGKIVRYAWENATFRKICQTTSYTFKSGSGNSYHLSTTNSLLGKMTGVQGVKGSYTTWDKYCNIGAIRSKNGKTYLSVVLGASSDTARWNDTKTLLNYAYNLG